MKRFIWAVLFLPAAGLAQDDQDIRYSWFGVGHVSAEIDAPGANLDASGWNFDASFAVREHIHLFGSYQGRELDDFEDFETSEKTFGIGVHFDIIDKLSLFGRVGFVDFSADDGVTSIEDDGGRVIAGVRFMPWGGFEFRGGVDYLDLDASGDDTGGFIGADIWLADGISLTGDYQFHDDDQSIVFGGRLYFGEW